MALEPMAKCKACFSFQEEKPDAIQLTNLQFVERIQNDTQDIWLYRHERLGFVLIINGELQHVQAWEALYHEPLVHLAASFVPIIRKVLVLGGGPLFATREILKYSSVEQVDQFELSSDIIAIVQRNYPHAPGILEDRRLNLMISDARLVFEFLNGNYDLIVNDCFDLSEEYSQDGVSAYLKLQSLLAPLGVCSDVVYRSVFEREANEKSISLIAKCSRSAWSWLAIPEYPGSLHLHSLWGRNPFLSNINSLDIQNTLQKYSQEMNFLFYNPDLRNFYFRLPPPLNDRLRARGLQTQNR